MTNVSLSRCVSFYSGQSRAKDSSIFIHWNPDFFLAFGGEELKKEQGHLGSLCAGPYRLHCRQSPIEANLKDRRRKTKQARNITFQSFFRHLTGFEDSKASLTSPRTKEQVLNFSN